MSKESNLGALLTELLGLPSQKAIAQKPEGNALIQATTTGETPAVQQYIGDATQAARESEDPLQAINIFAELLTKAPCAQTKLDQQALQFRGHHGIAVGNNRLARQAQVEKDPDGVLKHALQDLEHTALAIQAAEFLPTLATMRLADTVNLLGQPELASTLLALGETGFQQIVSREEAREQITLLQQLGGIVEQNGPITHIKTDLPPLDQN